MFRSLYNEKFLFRKIYLLFDEFFNGLCSKPTAKTYVLFVISMIVVEGVDSIRSLFSHCYRNISLKSLNSLYHALSYAKFNPDFLWGRIAKKVMSIIPNDLQPLPVFLCIDDTMIEKYGKKFENVQSLFDHAQHNGNKFMNGHCFVSIMLSVPVWNGRKFIYKGFPLGYKMWVKDGPSKLQIAEYMIDKIMLCLPNEKRVIILCDSWYGKTHIFELTQKYSNLSLICNVQSKTALYDLPPVTSGKRRRGAPRKHGDRILLDDIKLSDELIGDYYVGTRKVMINLLKWKPVYAFVTSSKGGTAAKRLFISTIAPTDIQMFCAWYKKAPLNQTGSSRMQYIPYILYENRWNIEICYYEQKVFWSLSDYKIRSAHGVETLLNLINLSYAGLTILPYTDPEFKEYKDHSAQEIRFHIGQAIQEEVFIANLLEKCTINNNSDVFQAWFQSKRFQDDAA